jgi:hypothetical protein
MLYDVIFSTLSASLLKLGLFNPTSALIPNLICEKAGTLSMDNNSMTMPALKIVSVFIFVILGKTFEFHAATALEISGGNSRQRHRSFDENNVCSLLNMITNRDL